MVMRVANDHNPKLWRLKLLSDDIACSLTFPRTIDIGLLLFEKPWNLPDNRRDKRLESVERFLLPDFVRTHLEYRGVIFGFLVFRSAVGVIIQGNRPASEFIKVIKKKLKNK